MRIALTGSSSTGKTTLALSLMKIPTFGRLCPRFITTDARGLLSELGFQSMDSMTREELRRFQQEYYERKVAREDNVDSFLTDRSFVDVAAYWLERDAYDLPARSQSELVDRCQGRVASYDVHFYCPFGIVPFTSDGYRSEDLGLHRRIDSRIQCLLSEWSIKHVVLDDPLLMRRVETVLSWQAAQQ